MYRFSKTSVVILLIVICISWISVFTALSQHQVSSDKLFGITFGATFAECEKNIKTNKGKPIVKLSNEFLYKKGIAVGKDTAYTVLLKFSKNKLYGLTVTFKPDYQLYRKIRDIISDKYTKPLSEEESFTLPFKRSDGNEENAVIHRKAKIWSIWRNSSIAPLDRTIELRIKRGENTNGEPFALLELECSVDAFAP